MTTINVMIGQLRRDSWLVDCSRLANGTSKEQGGVTSIGDILASYLYKVKMCRPSLCIVYDYDNLVVCSQPFAWM